MTRPVAVILDSNSGVVTTVPGAERVPSVGEEREGKVWDGEKWISKNEWEARQASH